MAISDPQKNRQFPVPSAGSGGRPELECDAAEDEAEQHRENREVDRRHDDREGKRESREEPESAEHEPGFVTVPDRRNRSHHQVAGVIARREGEKDSHAEVEAVEQHVHEDSEREDQRPDRNEVHGHGGVPLTILFDGRGERPRRALDEPRRVRLERHRRSALHDAHEVVHAGAEDDEIHGDVEKQ